MIRKKLCSALLICGILSAFILSDVAARGNVTEQEMIDAYNSGDAEAVEALIRTEDQTNPSKTLSSTLVIEDKDIAPVNRDHFGLHTGLQTSDGAQFLNGNTENLSEGYKTMADKIYNIPVARFGDFNLINSLGPRAKRKPTYNLNAILYPSIDEGGIYEDAPSMGLVESIKAIQAVNPEVKFVILLCINAQTAEDSLHTVQFLTDKKEDSDWGALRASYGIENPVNILGFELGNELYFAADFDAEYARMSNADRRAYNKKDDEEKLAQREAFYEKVVGEYAAVSTEHINAIRAHYPDSKFYACVCKHDGREYADYWTRGVASKLDGIINGLDYHHYYGGVYAGYSTASEMDYLQSVYSSTAGHKTKFVLTEHATWSQGNNVTRYTLYSMMGDASFYNTMQTRDDVICANYHNMIGQWAVFDKFGNHYSGFAENELLRMYYNHLGDTVIGCTQVDGTTWSISYLATRRKDGRIVVALVNGYDDTDINVSFNLPHQYKLLRQRVFTAPNLFSFVYSPKDEDIFVPTVTEMNQSNFSTYRLPAESIVFLTLEQTDSATPLGPEEDTKDEDEVIYHVEKNQKDVEAGDPFVAGEKEPDNVIYAEVPKEKKDGVYRFVQPASLRKIVNHESQKIEVFVSDDDYAYKKLCDIPANETYINILTSEKYHYFKVSGGENVSVYSALSDITLTPKMQSANLTARIDGEIQKSAEFSSDNASVAVVSGNTLSAYGSGNTAVTAKFEDKQTRETVSAILNKVIAEDFSDYEDTGVIKTPKLNLLEADIAGDWKLRRNYGGTVNTNPTAKIEDHKLHISGSSIVGITSSQLSYVVYDGDMTGIGNHYKISFEGNKVSVVCGIGVKFHIHDNGRSYYILWLNGNNYDYQTYWTFCKVKNGQIVKDSVRNGGAWTVLTETGKGPLHNDFAVTVAVDDNEISWQINGSRYADIAYRDTGSYTDADFPTVNPAETTFGFAENAGVSATDRFCNINRVDFTTEVYTRKETRNETVYTVDTKRLPENTTVYSAIYHGDLLKHLKSYPCVYSESNRFMDIVIPNSEKELGDTVKLFFWTGDIKPFIAPIKE